MFRPYMTGTHSYVLKIDDLVVTYNKQGKVIATWHPNNVGSILERNHDETLTVAELTLEQVVEVASTLAKYIFAQLAPNVRSTPSDVGFLADIQRDAVHRNYNYVAYGGRRAEEWVKNPTERGLPVSVLGVQAFKATCSSPDRQHPAQRLSEEHRMLLSALIFGEFVSLA